MVEFFDTFTDEQRALITNSADSLLVAAPAGSGKTRVLIGKLYQLVVDGVPPDRLCVLTFTKKSAQDIRSRLSALVAESMSTLTCHTFHSFALECLRADSGTMALGNDFQVLSPSQSIGLLRSVIEEVSPELSLSARDVAKLYRELSVSINCNQSIEGRLDRLPFEAPVNLISSWLDIFVERKLQQKAVDYDDLLFLFTLLLETDDEYRGRIAERYVHVLVDEYQDVNDLQARMVELLSSHHHRVFAIGDHAQSIYGFRGANIRHFRQFLNTYPGGQIGQLGVNFRSNRVIVRLAESLLKQDRHFADRNVSSARGLGDRVSLVGSPSSEAEAEFIASEISRLTQDGLAPSEISILVRLKSQAPQIELMLKTKGVPVNVKVGGSFLERVHVKDALALLRLVNEPTHEGSWRLLFAHLTGFGPVLSTAAAQYVTGQIKRFGSLDQMQRAQLFETTVLQGVGALLDGTKNILNLWCQVTGSTRHQVSQDTERDLLRVGALWSEQKDFHTLSDALSFSNSSDDFCEQRTPEVTLLSIHQSKGLEWHTVFVPGLNEGTLPVFGAGKNDDGLEEERRLL
ncbi:MAG: ATP-dependent helicase, partial [Bradymonadia bacterium]